MTTKLCLAIMTVALSPACLAFQDPPGSQEPRAAEGAPLRPAHARQRAARVSTRASDRLRTALFYAHGDARSTWYVELAPRRGHRSYLLIDRDDPFTLSPHLEWLVRPWQPIPLEDDRAGRGHRKVEHHRPRYAIEDARGRPPASSEVVARPSPAATPSATDAPASPAPGRSQPQTPAPRSDEIGDARATVPAPLKTGSEVVRFLDESLNMQRQAESIIDRSGIAVEPWLEVTKAEWWQDMNTQAKWAVEDARKNGFNERQYLGLLLLGFQAHVRWHAQVSEHDWHKQAAETVLAWYDDFFKAARAMTPENYQPPQYPQATDGALSPLVNEAIVLGFDRAMVRSMDKHLRGELAPSGSTVPARGAPR